jgi:predicted dehydrogenase
VKLLNTSTGELIDPAYPRKAPDHMFVQGVLNNGALASVNYRRSPHLIGKPTQWVISGTEGEIEFTVDGPMLQMGSHQREIRIKTAKDTDGARVIAWEKETKTPAYVESVAFPGQNTAYLFEDFVQGKAPDFEEALRLHKLLDRIVKDANPKYD